ncbi:hypothetical protein ODJ79_25785 [Actinoplanes sp. KI2]|uniref:hypothetical protein n=1 Tax=Actinoplanes sp. KI2 TaxID=2983315 RepID=UPI0021D5DE15|nr:hypothetical protein [Actinoplanes sp. KI2]MCU7727154.1 hypothetical protein [Actinoplanes sp. KI2]
MMLGLPIAVAAGWALATPARPPASIGAPADQGGLRAGGSDGLGTAPRRPARPQPLTEVQFTPRPMARVTLPVTAPSGAPVPTTAAPTTVEATSVTLPPILDDPPVPTPTEIIEMPSEEPPPPSVSPSPSPSSDE